MFLKHVLGLLSFKSEGLNSLELINALKNSSISFKGLYCKNECVYGCCYLSDIKKVKEHCKDFDMNLEIIKSEGFISFLLKYKKRFGIIVGAILAVVLSLYFSNTILKINIVGCDAEFSDKILNFLHDNGIHEGAFIPLLDYFEVEQNLKTSFKEISFANIRSYKSTLTVNVSMSDAASDIVGDNRRPSNIVSTKDAQIVKVEVLSGQLAVLVGSGVKKGDLLVSGIVDNGKGNYMYYDSIARIYGEYTDTVVFEQDFFITEENIINNYRSYTTFSFFDIEIPLFFKNIDRENLIENKYETSVRLFGIDLPFSINKISLDKIELDEDILSFEEAREKAYQKIEIYERNLLCDAEIIEKNVVENSDDKGIKLTVTYKIIDEIGMKKEIMLK